MLLAEKKLPVTIVAGLPHAGKTTLIRRAMKDALRTRTAVFSDAADLPGGRPAVAFPFSDDQLEWTWQGSAISLSQDLLIDIGQLSRSQDWDAALVEWKGNLDLMSSVDTFAFDLDGRDHHLADLATLDTLVSVIHAGTFFKDFRESRELRAMGISRGKYDERTLTDLLVEQLEWSNIILLSHVDQARAADVSALKALASILNPEAQVLPLPSEPFPGDFLFSGSCSLHKVGRFETWLPRPEQEKRFQEHGISSIFFSSRRPFHPERLHRNLEPYWERILRSKGILWLASRPDQAGIWSQAGDLIDMDWSTWEKSERNLDYGAGTSQDTPPSELGDPRQQLLLAGRNLPEAAIRAGLEKALLTDEEIMWPRSTWERFPDPFSFDAPVSDEY